MITSSDFDLNMGVLTTPPIKNLDYAVVTVDDYSITLGFSHSIINGLTIEETEFGKKPLQQNDKFVDTNTTTNTIMSVVIRHRNNVVGYRCFPCEKQEDLRIKTSFFGKDFEINLITKEKEVIHIVDYLLNSKPTNMTIKA